LVHPVVESLNSNSSLTSQSDCNSNSELIARIAAGDNFAFNLSSINNQEKFIGKS